MLTEIKTLVEIIRDSSGALKEVRSKRARSGAILELLSLYFTLFDVVHDGRTLLASVGKNPKETLTGLSEAEGRVMTAKWDKLIRLQSARLYNLSGRILGQDTLAIIDPTLREKLEQLVGSKFDRADSLEGVGAALVMYSMFGGGRDIDWQHNIILSLYPTRRRVTIDLNAARKELDDLHEALEGFRVACLTYCSKDEVLTLSRKARKQTKLSKRSC